MHTRWLWVSAICLIWACATGMAFAQPQHETPHSDIKLLRLSCTVTITVGEADKNEGSQSFSIGTSLVFEDPPQISLVDLPQVIGDLLEEMLLQAISILEPTSVFAPIEWSNRPFLWNVFGTPFENP